MTPLTTRFAPSPTGRLHLGHACSALLAWDLAQFSGGRFVLRIEDIDSSRCRPEFITAIFDDLSWLGLSWSIPVRIQSQHLSDHLSALHALQQRDLLYPCFCTRQEILREVQSAASAPHGPEGPLYPGTCKLRPQQERRRLLDAGTPHALRLDLAKAVQLSGPLTWEEWRRGPVSSPPSLLGDVVLARKDIPSSYHLAVTVDDALQSVSLVSRGEDLFPATAIHRLLQSLLRLPTPTYLHHPLLKDASGNRLSKRDLSLTLQSLRESGCSPAQIQEQCRAQFPPLTWNLTPGADAPPHLGKPSPQSPLDAG